MAFSKINSGKTRKHRGKHNLSHNVTTSQDFGIVMPYLCKMSSPQSSFRYSLDEKIRVMPMALPPFGSAKHHIYGQYVPLDSLWKAYGAFISQQPYATPFGNYTPSTTPYFHVGFAPVDSTSESGLVARDSLMKVFFSSAFTVSSLYIVSNDSTLDNLEFYNSPDNDPSGPGISISSSGTATDLGSITLAYSLNDYFGLGLTDPYSGFVAPDTPQPLYDRHFKPFCLDTFVNVEYNTADTPGESHQYNRINDMFHANTVGIGLHNGLTAQESNLFGISFESSDFQFLLPITYGSQKGKYKYLLCYKLNAVGRRLYSILRALGYDLNICSDNIQSPYKLLAYYKAWFDTFYPSRSRQWEQTYAARQCELWCDRGAVDIYSPETWYFQDSSFVSDSTAVLNFNIFLRDELCQTYATADPDYFTSSVLSANNEKQPLNLSLAGAGEYPSGSTLSQFPDDDVARVDKRSVLFPTSPTVNVSIKTSPSNQSYFTVQALQAALKFSKFVGTNNIVGSSIHKFLKAHFGVEGTCEETNFVGASVVPVEFGDVITTADTETGSTGDYSGVGYGAGSVHFNYHSPKDSQSVGYFLVFGAIIPPSNYSQGYDMENDIVTRFQYPFAEFDGLGYEPVKKGQLFTRSSAEPFTVARKPFNGSSLFGYQPRYLGLKVKNSVFSGDFACPSTMTDYLGFTFSNYITQDVRSFYENPVATQSDPKWIGSVTNPAESEFVASPEWRFLGKYPWRTNFSRIFKDRQIYGYNTNKRILTQYSQYVDVDMTLMNLVPHYDPFIISMNVDFFVSNNLTPISDSYEIIDGLDNYVKHE